MNDFLYVTYALNAVLMIAVPLGLAIYVTRKYGLDWSLILVGVATFIVARLLRYPLRAYFWPLTFDTAVANWPLGAQLLFDGVFLGLGAALIEELCRFGMYSWAAKDARTWVKGLLTGIGFGGAGAVYEGVLSIGDYVQFIFLRRVNLETALAPEEVAGARAQIEAIWSVPWYSTMVGAVEQLCSFALYLALAVIVLQVFTRKKYWWLLVAIGYHALAEGAILYAGEANVSTFVILAVEVFFAILSIVILFLLKRPSQPAEASAEGQT